MPVQKQKLKGVEILRASLSLIPVLGLIGSLFHVSMNGVPEEVKTEYAVIVGALIALAKDSYSYWFKDKNSEDEGEK